MSNSKRVTITINGMSEELAAKVLSLSEARKLTPYFVSLVEKEEKMDRLISNLSSIAENMDSFNSNLSDIKSSLDSNLLIPKHTQSNSSNAEVVKEGKLEVSDTIKGGIEEETEVDYD